MKNFFGTRGPLGVLRGGLRFGERRLSRLPGAGLLFRSMGKQLDMYHTHLDEGFDQKFGTDTGGKIPLSELTPDRNEVEECIWFETTSPKHFTQIMQALDIDFSNYTFVDFGSGKGRLLMMAEPYGFKKIQGVEFAVELHKAAQNNISIYEKSETVRKGVIESLHMDATQFPIPSGPVVLFFFTPFRGKVMKKVLSNISISLRVSEREIVLVYYGNHQPNVELFNSMDFSGGSLTLPMDYSRFVQYRCRIYNSTLEREERDV